MSKLWPGVGRWLSLWHVHTNEWDRNRSACLLSREIIQRSSLVSMHKGHTVQLCIFMLYRAGASCTNKASNGNDKLLTGTIAASKSDVWSVLFFFFFSCSSSTFARQICQTVLLSLSGTGVVYLTSHCGCLCFNFLRGVDPRVSLLLVLSSTSGSSGQVDFLCFHYPPYQFLFCPSSSCSWYSLMCRGNAAPGGIPPPPPPPPPVPNFTLTNWPRVPLPLTSLCSPWQLGPVHELAGPVRLGRNTELWDGRTLGGEILCKKQRAGEQNRPGRRRQREGDSVWVVGVGFWLKIEPLSFSPFAGFFVCQALATTAI